MKIIYRNIENRVAILFGLLGTMPIVTIGGLTVFSWLALISVFIFIVSSIQRKVGFNKFCIPYFVIMLLSVVTAIVCKFSSIPEMWKEKQTVGVIWNLLYLCIILYYSLKKNLNLPISYIKGVYIASVIHMIWGYFQFILYNMFGIKLNDLIFVNLLHMSEDSVTQIKSGSVAISGFCSNAGNMAPLLLIGYALSSSIILKLLFVICALLSGSRVSIITLFSFIFVANIVKKSKFKIEKRKILSIIIIFFIGFMLIVFSGKTNILWSGISKTLGYFSKETLSNQSSAIIHLRYWTSLFDVARFAGIERVLFGFGMGCSGYPFDYIFKQYTTIDIGTWIVETDYINQLWNLGLISFIIRYIWYGKYTLIAFDGDKKAFCFMIAMYIGGIFYNITFNWVFIMLCCLFILLQFKNGKNSILVLEENKYRRMKNAH